MYDIVIAIVIHRPVTMVHATRMPAVSAGGVAPL
jgi:hypothetical protein